MPQPEGAQPKDWYSVIGVRPDATTEQVTAAVERLARQANALAITAPERARQLRDQVRAIKQDLLAGAEQRQRYDRDLATRLANSAVSPTQDQVPEATPADYPTGTPAAPAASANSATPTASPLGPVTAGQPIAPGSGPPPSGSPAPGLMSRISKFLQAGWTCAACGYGALPTDKFCPKCGNRVEPGLGTRGPSSARAGQAGGGSPGRAPEARAAACESCGASLAPNDAFCTRCGAMRAPGTARPS